MSRHMRVFAAAIVCLLFLVPFGWSDQSLEKKPFTMALTGDSIISQKLSVFQEPEFLQMIDLIRSASPIRCMIAEGRT
jgi:hypothetical protein